MNRAEAAATVEVLQFLAEPAHARSSGDARRRLDTSLELLGHAAAAALAGDVLPLAQRARLQVDDRLRRHHLPVVPVVRVGEPSQVDPRSHRGLAERCGARS